MMVRCKKYGILLFASLMLVAVFTQTGCTLFNHGISFRNKYFIYSKDDVDGSGFWTPFYYASLNDTIYYVEGQFGESWEQMLEFVKAEDITPKYVNSLSVASYKYIVVKDKRCWYRNIYEAGKAERSECTYPLRRDTIQNRDGDHWVNTGVDTSFNFYGYRIKCRKYQQFRIGGVPSITTTYVEKRSFVPIMIKTEYFIKPGEFYAFDVDKSKIHNTSYQLRVIIDKDDIKQPFRKTNIVIE